MRHGGTAWGEAVGVVGSWSGWDAGAAAVLTTDARAFPKWSCEVEVPAGPVEYKYVVVAEGGVRSWEGVGRGRNRRVVVEGDCAVDDGAFGESAPGKDAVREEAESAPDVRNVRGLPVPEGLDALEEAVVRVTAEKKSWRQRLAFVRSLFTEPDVAAQLAFDSANIDSLATVSVYLSFLAAGQVKCEEDGGHHRPNHHAAEAQRIEHALAGVAAAAAGYDARDPRAYVAYVVRKIYPQLPSYSNQFTVSVPMTRIRDIAHRGDIPHDLKQEIKHTLQNKLHRCAGPEDLKTCASILERVSHGGYSESFVEQLRIFHSELRAFFNAASLDDRLRYLKQSPETTAVADLAGSLLELKQGRKPAMKQLDVLTRLRSELADLEIMSLPLASSGGEEEADLPGEEVQKVRLADIECENYAFPLLAGVAKDLENGPTGDQYPWELSLRALTYALKNMELSGLAPPEAEAAAAEASALADMYAVPKSSKGDTVLMHRTKAAVDRALRLTESFSSAISDVYCRRVASLGTALQVDRRAMAVYAEAEIRSNLAFLASRIADLSARVARQALNLPPWDPLLEGTANGRLVFVENLSDFSPELTSKEMGHESVILVCRDADGDEDIPACVRGVVLGRSLPHLSHLGVRARQAGVVFVCAEERNAFEGIWNGKSCKYATLVVNARDGLASLEEEYMQLNSSSANDVSVDKQDTGTSASNKAVLDIKDVDTKTRTVIPLTRTNQSNASSKCSFAGKLCRVAEDSSGLFLAPEGVALPHGLFQEQRGRHAKEYIKLVQAYSSADDVDSAATALRAFIEEKFLMGPAAIKAVQDTFTGNSQLMVRSSANAEDLEDMSGAGLYDSIANVPAGDASAVSAAVGEVWSSLWTKRAASSRAAYGVPHEKVSMAVLIQRMVPSDLSFVAFSLDPVSGDSSALYIEVAVGMGETLASASSSGSPYRFRVNRASMNVTVVAFSSYGNALVPNGGKEGGLKSQVIKYAQQEMTTSKSFRNALVTRIAKTVLVLEDQFGGPQDVEGAVVVVEGKATLHVVQARPQIL